MPGTFWTAPVVPSGWQAGTTVNTAVAAPGVDATPGPISLCLPAFMLPGQKLVIEAAGDYTTTATGANIIWSLCIGVPNAAITGAVTLAASSAIASVSTTSVAWPWQLRWSGTVQTLTSPTGTLGTIYGQGRLYTPLTLTTFNAPVPFPITAALRTVSFDTSVGRQLMLGVSLSAVTGAPAVTCRHLMYELSP